MLGVGCVGSPVGDTVLVNVDNFVRAETERMLLSTQAEAGGINRLGTTGRPLQSSISR
jgi:hypothetical protein